MVFGVQLVKESLDFFYALGELLLQLRVVLRKLFKLLLKFGLFFGKPFNHGIALYALGSKTVTVVNQNFNALLLTCKLLLFLCETCLKAVILPGKIVSFLHQSLALSGLFFKLVLQRVDKSPSEHQVCEHIGAVAANIFERKLKAGGRGPVILL